VLDLSELWMHEWRSITSATPSDQARLYYLSLDSLYSRRAAIYPTFAMIWIEHHDMT
jgi:hypothetical protein